MGTRKFIIMAALMSTVTMSAFGQQGPASTQPGGQVDAIVDVQIPGQPGRSEKISEKKREEIRKKIATVRIWRLTEALKLDATTSAKLSSLLSAFDHQRRNIHREQTDMISILRFAIRVPQPNESTIKTYLEKLEKNHHAMQELINSERRELKNMLTVEQQARYIVFQHEFTREMRGMIGSAHGNRVPAGRGGGQNLMRGETGQTRTPPSPANESKLQNRSK